MQKAAGLLYFLSPAEAGFWRVQLFCAGQEGQGQVLGGGGAAAWGFFEGGVAAVGRIFGLLAVENLLNRKDLQARVSTAVRGFVEPGVGGLFFHRPGGFFEAEKDTDLGFFARQNADKVANLWNADASGLDRKDDLLRFA